ncbi:MAG TPA: hypothetical protein VK989_06145, partial [Polyangia bacterium]|nr:hypothetical protein [Polyangia bacterium]
MKRLIQRRVREVLAMMICAGVVGACESGQPYTPGDGAPDTRASAKSDGAAATGDAPIETTDAPFDRGDALTDEGDAALDHADAPVDQTDAPQGDAPAERIDAPAEASSDASSDTHGEGGSDGALDARCHDDVCLAQGDQCSNSSQCGSGACVEGVCCESACASKCYSCVHLETGKADGMCAPVRSGTLHGNDCTATPKSGCGTTGTCNGQGDCLKWPAMTECQAAFCSADGQMATRASTCNGAGSCVGGGFQSCLTYACDTSKAACDTTCTTTNDCSQGYYCDMSTSTCGKKPDGIVCAGGVECQSGNCGGR